MVTAETPDGMPPPWKAAPTPKLSMSTGSWKATEGASVLMSTFVLKTTSTVSPESASQFWFWSV